MLPGNGAFADEVMPTSADAAERTDSSGAVQDAPVQLSESSGTLSEGVSPDDRQKVPSTDTKSEFDSTDVFEEFDAFDEFETDVAPEVFDPLSGYNRVVTRVNDRLYFWVLKPVAQGYKAVVPGAARQGISNFFTNLGFPIRLANNVLQLKFKGAGVETARFVVNTTVGVAGFWDPAEKWLALSAHPEDFGQTLGYYGMDSGFHIVLPLLGPSNLRDVCGSIADRNLNPTTYLDDGNVTLALSATRTINSTSLRIGQYETLRKDAMDLYILLRNAYEQNRDRKIKN